MIDINEYRKNYEFEYSDIQTDIESNKSYISNVTPDVYKTGYPVNKYWTFEFIDEISKVINFNDIKVILDIGSRDCFQSVEFKTWFPDSEVYAFEANPEAYDICKKISDQHGIVYVEKAVGDKTGKIKFNISGNNVGASSLLEVNENHHRSKAWKKVRTFLVDVIRIDEWCEENKIDTVDILWVDVQGAEKMVFDGCGDVLKNVKAIATEIGLDEDPMYHGGTKFSELHSFLEDNNFELIKIITHKSFPQCGEMDTIYVNKAFKQ